MTLGLLRQGQFELAHYPLNLLSLNSGILPCGQFILEKIILEPDYFKGNFSQINNYFIHVNRLIESYSPGLHTKTTNEEMKGIISRILVEQHAYQEASGLFFHNNEILLGRIAAIGEPQAKMRVQDAISDPQNHQEIWYHVLVGAYESEKSKWNFSFPEKAIIHLKTALFQTVALPDFEEDPAYFIDYLNIILFEFVYHIKHEKIKFEQVRDVFDRVFSKYQKHDLLELCLPEFQDLLDRYSRPQNTEGWLMDQMHALELQSQQASQDDIRISSLQKAFKYAVELARISEEEGQDKAIKYMAEIFELSGVVAE